MLQLWPDGAVRRAHVAASGRPPAAPVGACQGISHLIRFFVARLSFVLPLKDVASKAMATASSLHLDSAYSGDFLRNQWLGTDFFFFSELRIQDVSLSLIPAQRAHLMLRMTGFITAHFMTSIQLKRDFL